LILTYEHDDQGRVTAVDCGGVYRFVYTYDAKGRLTAIKQTPGPG
jgi:YD repeat-containing protein